MTLDHKTLTDPPTFVEVEMVYEEGRPGLTAKGFCVLQLWTQNRVYDVDWSMRCFRVASGETGEPIVGHQLLGARLCGGQRSDGRRLDLTYPLPAPGVAAVFEVAGEKPDYITTSVVTRVVLRIRVMSVEGEATRPAWSRLTHALGSLGEDETSPR